MHVKLEGENVFPLCWVLTEVCVKGVMVVVVIRLMEPHEYPKARQIDVTETGTRLVRMVEERLVEEPREWRRPPWGAERVRN
jgi:hypothetical protein